MRYTDIMLEADWYDKSPLVSVLRRNRGKWIHFTRGAPNRNIQQVPLLPEPERPAGYDRKKMRQYQRDLTAVRRKNAVAPVPKLGINPKSMWQDPKGVYFYPVNFLLSGFERITNDHQYGLDLPYYYIVDLNLNDPNGVNLDTMTWDQVEAIAKRNGWFDQMQEFRKLPAEQQQKGMFAYARPELPGSFFWHFIDRMVKDGKITWTKAFKGISYVRDPNLSIIHNNEPDQILVLDPKLITVIEQGENKSPIKPGESDRLQHWWHAMMTIIKRIRGEYGGDLTWMHKRPSLKFTKGYGQFELTVPLSSNQMTIGLDLSATYGRAHDQVTINSSSLRDDSVDVIVARLSKAIEKIAARKNDLLFKPIIPIAAAKKVMIDQITNHLGLSISTRIYNGDNSRYNSVSMWGETQRQLERIPVKTSCYIGLHVDHMSASCDVWIGKHQLMWAQSDYSERYTETGPMLENMAQKLRDNFDRMANDFAPKKTSGYSRHPRFDLDEVLTAFKGWAVLNCGLNLGGELVKLFKDEVAAFHAYPEQDRLMSEISYVMNSKW